MYYVMYKEFAQPILDSQPLAAHYDNKALVLTAIEPKNIKGEINRVCDLGFDESGESGLTPAQLTEIIDQLRAQTPNENIAWLSKPQGKWIYKSHVAFKTT